MKLLELPHLAQKEVLKQMMYEELFLMSYLSKRSKRMIQRVKRKGMIEIVAEQYSYKFCTGIDKIVFLALHSETFASDEAFRNEIFLEIIYCCMERKKQRQHMRYYYPSLIIYYRHISEMDTLAMIVYNQLKALFGNSVTFSLNIQNRYDVLPTFFNTKRSEISFRGLVNEQLLENYFKNVQEQEYLKISFQRLYGDLSSNSKFFKTQELDITYGEWYSRVDILSHFKGRILKLSTSSDIEHKICPFFARWKSCQELKNFESMDIFMESRGLTNIDGIKRRSGFKDLTPELKAFGQGERSNYSSYIVRDDGIVAKMLIDRFFIFMEVQSFTEEQMLKGTEVSV